MSGPSSGTRFKNKKQRNSTTSDDLHSNTLRKINVSGYVSRDDIAYLYNICKPVCQGCRVNSKDSPNCFCGFIPPPGGVRKHGLWQKLSETLSGLGADPSETCRPSLDSPAGLTNLGATCYVNSILQCLYMNHGFRKGFFATEKELVQNHPVLFQLALLFAQLHSGKKMAVDSAPFASTLELDNAVQQDGQEFLKLLLTLLERLLGQSESPLARNVVQYIFRGTLSHVIRCSKCGQESDASKKLVDFYEIELNVKGLMSLEESIDDYLSEEHLQGENQYFCESCNTRVDATYCIKLRSVPRVLNFQLKRFVFNAKTAMKKKVTSKLSFPLSIDMGPRLTEAGLHDNCMQNHLLYDLSAILVHKGSTANSGHYVAHIREEHSGQWWEFDDEQVTSLGSNPFREASTSTNTSKDVTSVKNGQLENCVDLLTDEQMLQIPEVKVNNESGAAFSDSNLLTSADAYMLMYNLRMSVEGVERCSPSTAASCLDDRSVEANADNPEKQGLELDFFLPDQLCSEVEELNGKFDNVCMDYKLRKEEMLSNISNRKTEVRSILTEAPAAQGHHFYWISSDWIRTWADSLNPIPPIDNSQLLCEHGKVPPMKVPLMKQISELAWSKLHLKYGGGPILTDQDCCTECIMNEARAVASANSYRDQRAIIKLLLEDALACSDLKGKGYFVSKTWLHNWQRRKPADGPSEADANPTASLRCQHGALLPENAPFAKRQVVPEKIWHYFSQIALQVGGDPVAGCACFPCDAPTCSTCRIELTQVASQQEDLRATKMEQRQRHEVLFSGKSVSIVPGLTCYLVPSTWIAQWRSYLGASGKNVLMADQPCPLENLIQSLTCQKHKGLLFRPPPLLRTRRYELIQRTTNDGVFTIVSEDDWKYFCEEWDIDLCKGIKAVADPMVEEAPISGCQDALLADISLNGVQQDDIEGKTSPVPALRTEPEVCEECTEERENKELMKKLHYVDGEIFVDLVHGKDPPRSVLTSSSTGSEADRRVSKRARRGSSASNGRAILKVSGDTTIYQLKLQIWEAFVVTKENQRIHIGKTELDDESATLAELNILPGAHLWVMDTGLHENRDIAEELSEQETKYGRTEEGFRGTLLANLPQLSESCATQFSESQIEPVGDDNVSVNIPRVRFQHTENCTQYDDSLQQEKFSGGEDLNAQSQLQVMKQTRDTNVENGDTLVTAELEQCQERHTNWGEREEHMHANVEKSPLREDAYVGEPVNFQAYFVHRQNETFDVDMSAQPDVSMGGTEQSLRIKEEQSAQIDYSSQSPENRGRRSCTG